MLGSPYFGHAHVVAICVLTWWRTTAEAYPELYIDMRYGGYGLEWRAQGLEDVGQQIRGLGGAF